MRDRTTKNRLTMWVLLTGLSLALAAPGVAQEGAATEPTEWEQTSAGNTVQAARMLYGQGVRDLGKADKLVERAEEQTEETKRAELLERATEANQSAVSALMQALRNDADMIEAYAPLGTAYRRLGDYQRALEVHAIALRRDPDNMENFEGWADALMHLNMLGNAVASYDKYAAEGSPRAPVLMDAIKRWLEEMQVDPGELDPAHVEKMAAWVAEKEQGG